jgi:adenine-specific DNA-methyltransferase
MLGVKVKQLSIDNEIIGIKMSNEQKVTNDIKVPNKELEVLKLHFPNCFDKEGNFQIEKFRQNLAGKEIKFSNENYGLDWLGKSYARLLASDPATTLLKEDETHNQKKENLNSENLLIKGDNLEVLKHLANAYNEKIKMIYIDPPYNTGNDGFVYQDDRRFTIKELRQLIGIDEEKAKRILDFTSSKSNSHSAWLTFMYPRLYIAKQLLKDDGVIFVSIDDNEVAQLRLLMDEIFGEDNFVSELCLINNIAGRSDKKHIATGHEYLLMYQKTELLETSGLPLTDEQLDEYRFTDSTGRYRLQGLRKRGSNSKRTDRPNMFYPIYWVPTSKLFSTEKDDLSSKKDIVEILPKLSDGTDGCWRWGKSTFNDKKEIIEIKEVSTRKEFDVFEKVYLVRNGSAATTKLKSYLYNSAYTSDTATSEFKEIINEKVFNSPKPIDLVKDLSRISTDSSDLILDYFAGSGTTGDAIMQLNVEDGGNRKFILVQLPETIDSKKNKTAYDFVKNELLTEPTIFEITKERLIRAAKKNKERIKTKIAEKEKEIKDHESKLELEEKDKKIKQLKAEIKSFAAQDLGFKIYETTPIWENYDFEAEQFDSSQTLFDVGKLTEDDINALLTTWKTYDGIALTQDLETIDLSGYTSSYGKGKLYLMNKGFTTDNLKTLLEKIDSDKKFNPTYIITFGYHFDSKNLRELSENVKTYSNKKNIDIDFITRY